MALQDLGYLVWFTVHKTKEPVRLPLIRARELFDELNLNPAFLPRGILPVHAFQAASSAITSTYYDNNERVDLKVREVKRGSEAHVRHVVRHSLDPRTRLASAATLIELKFFHAERTVKGRRPEGHQITERIVKVLTEATMGDKPRHFPLSEVDEAMAEDWLKRFWVEYEQLLTHLSADAIRTVVRDYLLSLDAILANSRGGVYFVPTEHDKTLVALRKFVQSIGPDCSLQTVVLVDNEPNRTMLLDVWRETTEDAIQKLNKEIEQLLARDKVALKSYCTIKDQWDALVEHVQTYATLTYCPPAVIKQILQPTYAAINELEARAE